MGRSIQVWENINAELLLFVFLPPLVFGESMNLNWHHVKGGLLQSIILAGPGVLVGAALVKYLYLYLISILRYWIDGRF